MAEFYFDTRDGSLLVGAAAIEPRVEEAGPAVVPLRDLLTDEDFPYTTHDYQKIKGEHWSHEEIASLGSWALRVIKQEGEPLPVLTRRHYERLYVLGLGPYMRRQKSVTSMRALRAAAGSPEGVDPGVYDDWTASDFTKYAHSLSKRLGRRPRKYDYDESGGPTAGIIHRRFGSVGELNEMIGYPNVRAWQPEDYIEWGVQVMRANPHKDFSYELLEDLSRRDRGPSESPIYRRFGTFTNFRNLVAFEFTRQESETASKKAALLERFDSINGNGELSTAEERPESEKLQYIGKYELARQCLANKSDKSLIAAAVATLPPAEFVKKLRSYNEQLDVAKIETEAVILDVHAFIWPPQDPADIYRVA